MVPGLTGVAEPLNLRVLLSSPLGFFVGLLLGALGGGGSVLAVPILVYVAGQDPQEATSTALLIVTLTAFAGIVPHSRAGNVRVGAGIAFGAAGVAGSVAGSAANALVDPDVLLLAFAGLLVVVAVAMIRQSRTPSGSTDPAVASETTVETAVRVDAATVLKVFVVGTGIGLLTGFFGVGGGFVIVPALTLVLRFPIHEAVGTSLLVIAINAIVALIARQAWGTMEWSVALPFTLSALLGVAVGTRLASRIESRILVRRFGQFLVLIALYTAIRTAISLWFS